MSAEGFLNHKWVVFITMLPESALLTHIANMHMTSKDKGIWTMVRLCFEVHWFKLQIHIGLSVRKIQCRWQLSMLGQLQTDVWVNCWMSVIQLMPPSKDEGDKITNCQRLSNIFPLSFHDIRIPRKATANMSYPTRLADKMIRWANHSNFSLKKNTPHFLDLKEEMWDISQQKIVPGKTSWIVVEYNSMFDDQKLHSWVRLNI